MWPRIENLLCVPGWLRVCSANFVPAAEPQIEPGHTSEHKSPGQLNSGSGRGRDLMQICTFSKQSQQATGKARATEPATALQRSV